MIVPPAPRAERGHAVASTGKQREAREQRERTRQYQARQTLHADRKRRRTRDNVIAGVVGGILLLGLVGAQTAYYLAGPGAPVPTPASTPTPTDTAPPLLPGQPTP
jgi:hypothetical protein